MTGAADLRQTLRDIEVFAGELPGFDPSTAPDTPFELFTEWLLKALSAGVQEPHAMTLATADAKGDPTARVLILKDVSLRAGNSPRTRAASRAGTSPPALMRR